MMMIRQSRIRGDATGAAAPAHAVLSGLQFVASGEICFNLDSFDTLI